MIVSVHQPQYLPWLGYFDKIAASDLFVALDLPQFKKREYQNRNRIKGAGGEIWLTVPVITKGRYDQPIREVEIRGDSDWQKDHWKSIELNYKKAPHWERYAPQLKAFYEKPWTHLCALNLAMQDWFLKTLGIETPVKIESELGSSQTSTERLIELVKKTGGDTYLSGAGGKGYMDEGRFEQEGLKLQYQHYEHPQYPQRFPKQGFQPYMCVLDLLFNVGPDSLAVLRGEKKVAA